MSTPDPLGGGSGDGGSSGGGPRNMVPPSYYRTPYFPYAGLDAQLMDALGLAGRGAGGFTNMASPLMQSIKNTPANLGGGLLGMTAYSRGKSYTPTSYTPTMPGTGPAGTPTIPGGYAPGSPMQRPGAPVAPGTPGRGGAPVMPTLGSGPNPFQQANPRAGGGAPPPTGAGARSTGLLGTPGASAGGAPLPYSPGQQFNPGAGGGADINKILADFNATPMDRRGDFINAIDQWGLGKGGPQNIGAALQQALRSQMGQQAFDQWYASNVTNKQGSGITSLSGLPAYLQGLK